VISRLMATYQFTDHVEVWSVYPFDVKGHSWQPQTRNRYFNYPLSKTGGRIVCVITICNKDIAPSHRQYWADRMMLELAKRGEL
jgi:hypothetical protein